MENLNEMDLTKLSYNELEEIDGGIIIGIFTRAIQWLSRIDAAKRVYDGYKNCECHHDYELTY